MKMELLSGDGLDSPILRLFDYDATSLRSLRELALRLSGDSESAVRLDRQSWVQPIDGCCADFRRGPDNAGTRLDDRNRLVSLGLNRDGWLEFAEKLEPLFEVSDDRTHCFQWLVEAGDVRVLVSKSGQW